MTGKKAKPGPNPDKLVIDGDWEEAVKKAVGVKRPADGWPDPDNRKKPRGKKAAKSNK